MSFRRVVIAGEKPKVSVKITQTTVNELLYKISCLRPLLTDLSNTLCFFPSKAQCTSNILIESISVLKIRKIPVSARTSAKHSSECVSKSRL